MYIEFGSGLLKRHSFDWSYIRATRPHPSMSQPYTRLCKRKKKIKNTYRGIFEPYLYSCRYPFSHHTHIGVLQQKYRTHASEGTANKWHQGWRTEGKRRTSLGAHYFIYLFIHLYTCNDFSLSRFGIQMSAQVIEEIIVFF